MYPLDGIVHITCRRDFWSSGRHLHCTLLKVRWTVWNPTNGISWKMLLGCLLQLKKQLSTFPWLVFAYQTPFHFFRDWRKRLQTNEADAGVKTMKTALLDSLSARCQLDEAPEYTIATLLDPRYKTCFYSAVVSEAVIGQIKSKLAANQIQSTANNAPEAAEDEPARKKPRIADSLFDCVNELLECVCHQYKWKWISHCNHVWRPWREHWIKSISGWASHSTH